MAIQKTVKIPAGANIAKAKNDPAIDVLILNEEYDLVDAYIYIIRTENVKGDVMATIGYKRHRNMEDVYTEAMQFQFRSGK